MELCSFPGCNRPGRGKYCPAHYQQVWRGVALGPIQPYGTELCSFPGCDRPHYAKLLCHAHYASTRRGAELEQLRPLRRIRPRGSPMVRDAEGRKWCATCDRWLSVDSFGPDPASSDGLKHLCRECMSYYHRHRRFRLTKAQQDEMMLRQEGKCATCGRELLGEYRVDHDHSCCPGDLTCGKCTRGLLCDSCNKALGYVNDSPDTLRRMLEYLQKGSMP